ncbi:MAG: gamma-glutamyltransferase family protein [Bryobacteraceae bacterium]|nr:gamma-glutamyltransferase family protein [Bryobacteraceae bacterium]
MANRIARWLIPVAALWLAWSGWAQRREMERPMRQAARGTRGGIAAGTEFGAEAGMRLYHAGGNAVDAGVATMFAAAVTEYSHFGFGGEAPILIRSKDGKVFSIAGVGTMPKAASGEFFRNRRLQPGEILAIEPGGLKGMVPVAGMMPVLVPGMVDAGLLALREFGVKSLAEVMAPAIDLADGVPIDDMRATTIARTRRFFDLWPNSKAVFLPGGRPPRHNDIFRQPDLARTMRSMVDVEKKALAAGKGRQAAIDAVRDFFYRGEIAKKIDAFSRANEGLIRYEDMAAFKLQLEQPVTTNYRGYQVYKAGFWSQGPSLIETLNMAEGFDLQTLRHNSAEYVHRLVEALKLAYADRDTYYGDPRFAKIPADVLLSKQYAADRRATIGYRASQDFVPGTINGQKPKHPSEVDMARHPIDDILMARDTTCIDAIDHDGLMFSATPSGAWLPSVIAGDTGIPLTQRAQSFLLIEGHPNELAGGKRPRVTLSPTLITKDGKPFLVLSTPGGDNQDQSLLQVMLNVIEFGMDAQRAVEAPRFQTRHLVSSFDNHAMTPGDLLIDERMAGSIFQDLSNRGHKLGTRSRWASGAMPVVVRVMPNGVIEAGADPYGYRVARAW